MLRNFNGRSVQTAICVAMPNIVAIGQNAMEVSQFF